MKTLFSHALAVLVALAPVSLIAAQDNPAAALVGKTCTGPFDSKSGTALSKDAMQLAFHQNQGTPAATIAFRFGEAAHKEPEKAFKEALPNVRSDGPNPVRELAIKQKKDLITVEFYTTNGAGWEAAYNEADKKLAAKVDAGARNEARRGINFRIEMPCTRGG